MFAKLKKKIQEEGGAPGESERSPSAGPYGPTYVNPSSKDPPGHIYSPSRRDSTRSDSSNACGDAGASGGQNGGVPGSGEETSSLLQKKSEQIKKMETKVSELAAMIKDKNKTIERLETSLNSQQQVIAEKLKELIQETSHTSENGQDRSQEKSKSKQALEGAAAEEFIRLQRMVVSMHKELGETRAARIHMTEHMQAAKSRKENLEEEVQSLMSQIAELTMRCETAEESLKCREDMVEQLTAEKQGLLMQLEDVQREYTQRSAHWGQIQQELAVLQDQHITLQRNSDLHRQKITNMLEEKDEIISRLGERNETLENRLKENDLSGDDRINALLAERSNMEHKLNETRQQLSEVKATWSDKISALEKQISKLNEKMVEDSLDWTRRRQEWEETATQLYGQIEELQQKVKDRENLLHESQENAKHKDRLLEIQKDALEKELTRMKQSSMKCEGELQNQIEVLKSQHAALQTQYNQAAAKIRDLQNRHDDYLEKEIDLEKQITQLEDDLHQAKVDVSQRDKELSRLQKELQEKTQECEKLMEKVQTAENSAEDYSTSVRETDKQIDKLQRDLSRMTGDRDSLLVRNAELRQQVESVKKMGSVKSHDLEKEVKDKDNAIAGLEQALQEVQAELAECRNKLEEERSAHEKRTGELESEEIQRLRQNVTSIEDQLTEKNKTIKMQQQRLIDLKKTLQRELKVQGLPNDEVVSDNEVMHKPATLAVTSTTEFRLGHHFNGRIPKSTSLNQLNHVGSLGGTVNPLMNRCVNCSRNKDGTPYIGPAPIFDEANFEYLKHVILKFMLSRETEALQLIKAVSTLLMFSEEEQHLLKDTLEYKMSWFGSRPKLGKGQKSKVIPPSY